MIADFWACLPSMDGAIDGFLQAAVLGHGGQ
jgi:hypothetical protein